MTVSRRKSILEQIKTQGKVLITELSGRFKVSEVTIRNDLEFLEQKNLIVRVRGGAIVSERNVGMEQHIAEKSRLHALEKQGIGFLAAQLIRDRETVILDSGTTTAEIAKNLDNIKHLTVITNAINIVSLLSGNENIDLVVPGGIFRQKSMSLVGPMAEKNLKNFFVDKVFLSTDGFDLNQGIFTPNIEEASLNGVMIENAKEVILVTDSSKFNRRSLVLICSMDKIKTVITDRGISSRDKKNMEERGMKVVISDNKTE